MKWMIVWIALFAWTASAADVAGTWKASTSTPDGNTFETTFVFKVDGEKLTGSTSNQFMADTPISEGKVDVDNVSFLVVACNLPASKAPPAPERGVAVGHLCTSQHFHMERRRGNCSCCGHRSCG